MQEKRRKMDDLLQRKPLLRRRTVILPVGLPPRPDFTAVIIGCSFLVFVPVAARVNSALLAAPRALPTGVGCGARCCLTAPARLADTPISVASVFASSPISSSHASPEQGASGTSG